MPVYIDAEGRKRRCRLPNACAGRRFLVCRRSDRMEAGSQVVCDLGGLMEYIERSP